MKLARRVSTNLFLIIFSLKFIFKSTLALKCRCINICYFLGMASLSMNASNVHGQQNTYNSQIYHKMNVPINNGPSIANIGSGTVSQPPLQGAAQTCYATGSQGSFANPSYRGHQAIPGSMTPPIAPIHNSSHHLSHASSMPNLQHHMHGSSTIQNTPTFNAPLFNVNDQIPPVATVAEPTTSSYTSAESGHVGKPLFYMSTQGNQQIINNPMNLATSSQQQMPEVKKYTSQPPGTAAEQDKSLMNTTMPSLSTTENLEAPHHIRSNSMPDFKPLQEGTPSLSAPPTDGYYTRSLSPNPPQQRTPSPQLQNDKLDASSSSEHYNNVIDQLNFALDKCSTKLDRRLYDDVKRKLDTLENQWHSESILKEIKERMVLLATGEYGVILLLSFI